MTMADARREHEYDVAINHACHINDILNGKFNPGSSNPMRNQRTEVLQNQSSDPKGTEGFAMLGAGLLRIVESVKPCQ
jgi:hypothetical protein